MAKGDIKQRAVRCDDELWDSVVARAKAADISTNEYVLAVLAGMPVDYEENVTKTPQVIEAESALNTQQRVDELEEALSTMKVRLLTLEKRGKETALVIEEVPVRLVPDRRSHTQDDTKPSWTPGIGLSKWQQAHPGKRENGS